MRGFLKQTLNGTSSFIKKCANALSGIFRKRGGADAAYSPDDTRVFDGYGKSRKSAPHQKKTGSAQKRQTTLPYISKEHLSGEGKEHIDIFTVRQHNPSFLIGVLLTSVKLLVIGVFMVFAAGIGTLVGIAKAYMDTTPVLDTAEIENQALTSYIYDGDGNLITAYTGIENRDWASFDEIPDMLKKAFIAIEDVRFYYHSGVDLKRLAGVFVSNLMNTNLQGGSTITQQLIKNSLLSPERTYKRKIQEAYLAMQLEERYTKDQILTAYLNTIPLGGTDYGVKAAALDYFGKKLNQLTLRECAMLAGITQNPSKYNPRRSYYVLKNPDLTNKRTDNVLLQMYKANFITKEQYEYALADSVTVLETSSVNAMYDCPYFVEYAVYDVITHMLQQRSLQDNDENRAKIDAELRTGGYKIYLTLDRGIQHTVENSLANWTKYPKLKDSSDAVVTYENGDGSVTEVIQPQASAVVLDQHTGQLKAVVGGRTEPTARKTLNRAYQTSMPVGSSIKPIAVYAPAIDKGYSDGTVVPNIPIPISGWNSTLGYPSGGKDYYGPVTLRTALVHSLNSATAYTLMDLVGLQDSYNYLIQMGINPSHIDQTGSGLALGTSGITPVEMAGAYAAIANGGLYLEPLSFTKVVDRYGNVVLDADKIRVKRQVFKPSTAWLVSNMLVDAVNNGTGKKAQINGMTVGGKTGTNQNVKGIFFAGITPYYTSTLWIGHDKFKPLSSSVYSSDYAAPLWQNYMSLILKDKPDAKIIDADPQSLGLIKRKVCSVSGLLATDACELDAGGHKPVDAWFLKGTEPTESCDIHEIYTVCKESGKIASPYCPDADKKQTGLIFLQGDSPYLKLSADQLSKYLPGAFPAPYGFDILSLTPDDAAYATYFCNIHTKDWYDEQQKLAAAITAANIQIKASEAALSDPSLPIPLEDRNRLSSKIEELKNLIKSGSATSGAVEQKTRELKDLTDQLVALYSFPSPSP